MRRFAGSARVLGVVLVLLAAGLGAAASPAAAVSGVASCDSIVWVGGTRSDVFTAADNGAGRFNVTDLIDGSTDPTSNASPQWSPDGSRITWSGSDGATNQIWVANADGTGRAVISSVSPGTDPTLNFNPQWSPDGSRVVWSGSDGVITQIWVANADGTGRAVISSASPGVDPTSNFDPEWSLDGTRIAWSGFDGATNQIWVADADGTGRVVISSVAPGLGPTGNISPQWKPAVDPFTDVAAASFARSDVTCIYELGITTGTGPTTYGPSANVTREQMASFLARLIRSL